MSTKITKSLKKYTAVLIILVYSLFTPFTVLAIELPPAPPPIPTAPTPPNSPPVPTAPTPPPIPTAPTPPTATIPPSSDYTSPSPTPEISPTSSNPLPTANQNSNNQTSDTVIVTGDSNITSDTLISGNQNTNLNSSPTLSSSQLAEVSANGSNSTNNTQSSQTDTAIIDQNNSGNIINNQNLDSTTGQNSASQNLGNSYILTGNANASVTALATTNTNIDAVAVNTFNISDNHTGDIILSGDSTCISNCPNQPNQAVTTNGSDSQNSILNDSSLTTNTFQSNDTTVGNNLVLNSDTGNNQTNLNTGGDSVIKTGDANVSANSVTFANNNLLGNVILNVVNIFGNFIGDIILPESALGQSPATTSASSNLVDANGSDTTNTAITSSTNQDITFQSNDATIQNNLLLNSNSGGNETNLNTGGDSVIKTGNTLVDASVVNIANNNIESDQPLWLVIVNDAGKWIGQIIGLSSGTQIASSENTSLEVTPDGNVNFSGNGAGSTNQFTSVSSSTGDTHQTNSANIVNNLDLTANTGNNSSSQNTNGYSYIETGDAKIIANLVNFVNNNISGNGKLIVSLINVFGTWTGNFLPPGTTKPVTPEQTTDTPTVSTATTPAIGGIQSTTMTFSEPILTETIAPIISPTITTRTSRIHLATSSRRPSILGSSIISSDTVLSNDSLFPNSFNNQNKKVIDINLAWTLLLLPITLFTRIFRRIYLA